MKTQISHTWVRNKKLGYLEHVFNDLKIELIMWEITL